MYQFDTWEPTRRVSGTGTGWPHVTLTGVSTYMALAFGLMTKLTCIVR